MASSLRQVAASIPLAVLLLLAGAPLCAQMGPSNTTTPLPPGEGKELVAVACSQCHGLKTIMILRDGPEGWKRFVQEMVLRGAQLNQQEADTVVKYLVKNFGPGAGRMQAETAAGSSAGMGESAGRAAASLPNGPGKELVQSRCAVCHDLGRITTVKRTSAEWERTVQDMVARGASVTPDEMRSITSYLAGQFGKKAE